MILEIFGSLIVAGASFTDDEFTKIEAKYEELQEVRDQITDRSTELMDLINDEEATREELVRLKAQALKLERELEFLRKNKK